MCQACKASCSQMAACLNGPCGRGVQVYPFCKWGSLRWPLITSKCKDCKKVSCWSLSVITITCGFVFGLLYLCRRCWRFVKGRPQNHRYKTIPMRFFFGLSIWVNPRLEKHEWNYVSTSTKPSWITCSPFKFLKPPNPQPSNPWFHDWSSGTGTVYPGVAWNATDWMNQ